MKEQFNILLSRTDSIGDVVLTLPMAGWIKKQFPKARVYFLGRAYTKEVVGLSSHVDEFVSYDELEKMGNNAAIKLIRELKLDIFLHVFPQAHIAKLAKAAAVPLRVGTTNRIYHWYTCNKLISLSRKNSSLHEAQLNLQLLSFLNINTKFTLNEIPRLYGFDKVPMLDQKFQDYVKPNYFNLILHPRSKGSAREWGLHNFLALIKLLPSNKYKIFISGTAQDAESMKEFLADCKAFSNVQDITGQMNLKEFIAFINACDGLVAASTGPLHIAAALSKKAIGLFSARRPIHPGRWAPLGDKAFALVWNSDCPDCKAGKDCDCISRIAPETLVKYLSNA